MSANDLQEMCSLCRFIITWCCSKCEDDVCLGKSYFFYGIQNTKRMCFAAHVKTCILDEI